MRRRGVFVLCVLLLVVASVAGLAWSTWPETASTPDWSDEYDTSSLGSDTTPSNAIADTDYDLTARSPEEIAPGTVVGRTHPKGWSHLLIKSLPRVRNDQKAGLAAITIEKASWMFTALVADVRGEEKQGETRYRFRSFGLGLGTAVNGRDMILTPETGKEFGADLSWIDRTILGKGYEIQRKALVVVRGPTFGLLDTPVWFRCAAGNRLLRYRYAVLVDSATSQLDVLVWRLENDGGGCGSGERAIWLNPDTIDTAELVVDRKKMSSLGLPADDAFAVAEMPHGRNQIAIPADLRPIAARTRFTVGEVRLLESGLRKLLSEMTLKR